MRRIRQSPILLLVLTAAIACDDGRPWPGAEEQVTEPERHDFGPTAAFDRRLIFVGPGEGLPTAAVFDFVALSDSAGIRRGARGRLVQEGDGWITLLDEGWDMDPMREPWRLVPHGPLKMVVSDAGEMNALLYRTDTLTVRLALGGALAEHSPDAGTQLLLRQASLQVGGAAVDAGEAEGGAVDGVVLDAQLGRAVEPDSSPAPVSARAPASDSAAFSSTPAARPGAEAFVLDGRGYSMVLARASGGELAWVYHAGQSEVIRGTRLEPTAWADFPEAESQVPTAWRLLSPQGRITGELDAEAADHIALSDGLAALGYVLVTGWIEDRGARRDVFGLVRHVR